MNILIPHSWLLEHLETEAAPEDIQRLLSLSGPAVERIYEREGEAVYDIEVTTNRVDSMSVRGIAREAAVILTQAGIPSQLKPLAQKVSLSSLQITEPQLPLPKIVNDPTLCDRVLCLALRDVNRTPTPEWMAKRLKQIDQNVHDSVIDITNYITHELGHPCHAFDYDKIMSFGGEIIVKQAEADKQFTTLDGLEYTTVGGEVVFENADGIIIDLPAIKGTVNTSISQSTRNVLLWIEDIHAERVRFASMTHNIRTVAAQLSEKNVDPHLGLEVILRGVELYQDLCQAGAASPLFDDFSNQKPVQPIAVTTQKLVDYLGVNLKPPVVERILTSLGCEVEQQGNSFVVVPPTFRPDLQIPADIVEEVARIYGYHNLPSTLMATPIPLTPPENLNVRFETCLRHFLADIGWQEVYTYSMVSAELAEQSGYALAEHLKLQNPLTEDRVYLRRSLIPSLAEALLKNPDRKNLSMFEIANVYVPQSEGLPLEQLELGLVSTKSYRAVKGDLEALLQQFHIKQLEVQPKPESFGLLHQQGLLLTTRAGTTIELGTIGVTAQGDVAALLDIATVLQVSQFHPTYTPAPKTALIKEDMTFTLPEKTLVGEVLQTIKAHSELIVRIDLKDVFHQNYTFTISYLDAQKNLTTDDIEPVRKQLRQAVQDTYQGALVGDV